LKKLGPEHPDVARSYRNLGIANTKNGKYDIAIKYHKRELRILSSKRFSSKYGRVAFSFYNLSQAFRSKNDKKKTTYYATKAVKIAKKRLGTNHPHTKLYD